MDDETPPDDNETVIRVYGFGLTPDEAEALFDRVADAAHALDQQVACAMGPGYSVGRPDLEPWRK